LWLIFNFFPVLDNWLGFHKRKRKKKTPILYQFFFQEDLIPRHSKEGSRFLSLGFHPSCVKKKNDFHNYKMTQVLRLLKLKALKKSNFK
jgi:hypothetical protein